LDTLITSLGVALLVGTFVVDVFSTSSLAVPILYAVSIPLLSWSGNLRLVWSMAAVSSVLTFALYVWGPPTANPQFFPAALLNRVLSCAVIGAMAALAHLRIRAERFLRARNEMLDKQFAELEALNEELTQREQEMVRQNEELRSQTEELEQQSEELRVANEELMHWEKLLEQLLQLSRSLTASLGAEEIQTRICEALGMLFDGCPAAMLERRAERLVVACHHGFGPEGPLADVLPYASTFAATVMAVGQTAYLENVALRPELLIPQPKQGERFRSVLSSPLYRRGRVIGTIEVYSPAPRTWSDAEVSLVESLAAQASVSLQGAELVDAIRYERGRFEAAFRNVPFGMMVAEDADCQTVRVNPAAASMLSVSVDENLSPGTPAGAKVLRLLRRHGLPIASARHPLIRAAQGEEIVGEELEVIFPHGRQLQLLVSAAPVHGAGGRLEGAVCAFADVTAQKHLQRELELRRREAEEASARKTRFLAAVSHDIRTPANAISLMAELIHRYAADPATPTQIAELAEDLQRNTLSLIELIGDVLDLARFDTGKSDLVETEFPLADLIEQETRQHQPLAREKGLDLEVTPISRTLWLRTDRVKLGRVLGNLIGNAIKFTERGKVTISTAVEAQPEGRVCITIRDTGVGVPPEQLPGIFDEFRQLHNPARNRNQGAGLGLSICKRLVDLLGGEIEVESTPGQGSRFTVCLPATALALRLEPALRPADVERARKIWQGLDGQALGLRVLLVEDHGSTREGTARILRSEGASVVEAPDGCTALALLSTEKPDVLLLDMMLPDMDGREILRRVQSGEFESVKAIFVLTGDLTDQRKEEIKLLGADGLIEKPIDVNKLLGKLRDIRQSLG
jgi:signal transduction histidine kinase/response regulator RpfG family c-di-GMP phosphodiesterase